MTDLFTFSASLSFFTVEIPPVFQSLVQMPSSRSFLVFQQEVISTYVFSLHFIFLLENFSYLALQLIFPL